MKREVKYRPSMTWDEMALAVSAMETMIDTAVRNQTVTMDIVAMSKVKKYMETFKPALETGLSDHELLISLMKQFNVTPATTGLPLATPASEQTVKLEIPAELLETKPPLTNEERYDLLKLSGDANWTEDDTAFMCNVGTRIMMKRAGMSGIDVGDL